MSQAVAAAPPPPADDPGFFGRLFGLYFSPGDAFRSILPRPMIWAPILAMMALHVAFTAAWVSRVDPHQFMRNQMEDSGQADRMSPEQLSAVIDQQSGFFKVFAWVTAPIVVLAHIVIALVFLLVFKLFYSAPVAFKQAWAVVVWTFLATGLVTTPLTLLVMGLKGDWNIDPAQALMANAAALLDKGDTPKALYSLAGSLDLISFWNIFLLATGFAVATRRPVGSAAAGIIGLWAVYVLLKVGWAALMS